jgi:hypothetical protein
MGLEKNSLQTLCKGIEIYLNKKPVQIKEDLEFCYITCLTPV